MDWENELSDKNAKPLDRPVDGYSDTLFLLINSIYKLGFSLYNIKYIIHTHCHGDHIEATAALVHLTGAKTFMGENDAQKIKGFFDADVLHRDGDVVKLGNTAIEVMETPGHTEGCISLFFETEESGTTYRIGMFGGAGAMAEFIRVAKEVIQNGTD